MGWSLARAGEGGGVGKISIPVAGEAGARDQIPPAGEMAGVKVLWRQRAVLFAPPGPSPGLLRQGAGEAAGGRAGCAASAPSPLLFTLCKEPAGVGETGCDGVVVVGELPAVVGGGAQLLAGGRSVRAGGAEQGEI